MENRVLIATSVGPGKEYTLAFLLPVLRRLEGAAGVLLLFDGTVDCPEAFDAALQEAEDLDLQVQNLVDPPEGTAWAQAPTARCSRMRAAARAYFLAGEWTHLFFLDADTIPPKWIIPGLLDLDVPVATGLYNMRGHRSPRIPATAEVSLVQPGALTSLAGLPEVGREGSPSAGQAQANLYNVAHFGMGCMLIRRDALEAVPFRDPEGLYAQKLSEDVAWGADLAAAGLGPIRLDPAFSCWHVDDDGTATRLLVGEAAPGAIWTGDPATVRNQCGLWERSAPRTDLTPEQLATLGPEFVQGHYPRLSVDVRRVEELL